MPETQGHVSVTLRPIGSRIVADAVYGFLTSLSRNWTCRDSSPCDIVKGVGGSPDYRYPARGKQARDAPCAMLFAAMEQVVQPHILVVEDHHESRKMLCDVLESQGFRASGAMSASFAMTLIGAGDIDVIVTDITLAGSERSGVWLRNQVKSLDIPVIAITGHARRLDEFSRLVFSAVLLKPLDIDELVAAVRTAIANGAGAALRRRAAKNDV